MQDNQFYPSTDMIARRAYNKFKNKTIRRLLEPSAGRGDLLAYVLHDIYSVSRIDCVEIDLDNQAILRSKKLRVVGDDFLKFHPAYKYSHVLLNPPFLVGVKHVLHAWSIVDNAEIVAVLNATNIDDPCTAERQQLAKLIEDHSGSEVEFIDAAFMDPDTKRKTNVRVALVHLIKQSENPSFNIDFISKLREEKALGMGERICMDNALMLPQNELENRVIDFQCAVDAMMAANHAIARAGYIRARLGKPFGVEESEWSMNSSVASLEAALNERINDDYDKIKEVSWRGIFECTDFVSRLTSKAAEKVKSEFDNIKKLEFTLDNIYGFIDGLTSQQSAIQMDVMCEVFDIFSKYHTENRSYYQSWKSNDKHRTQAHRLKMTRFVLPAKSKSDYYPNYTPSFNFKDKDAFGDIDRAFALLDGKTADATDGIVKALESKAKALWLGERVSTEYFDIRFYVGAATFHLFPRNKELVDRLNDMVGKHRQWLPNEPSQASDEFWEQYRQADKVNKKFNMKGISVQLLDYDDGTDGIKARQHLKNVLREAQLDVGIDYQPPLLMHCA